MVLVDTLRVVHPAIQRRSVVLRETHKGLDEQQDIEYQTKDGVRRVEVITIVTDLVDLNDDKTGNEGRDAYKMKKKVRRCASALLARSMGGLEDEGCLCNKEKTGRVQELEGGYGQ